MRYAIKLTCETNENIKERADEEIESWVAYAQACIEDQVRCAEVESCKAVPSKNFGDFVIEAVARYVKDVEPDIEYICDHLRRYVGAKYVSAEYNIL